MNEYSEDFDWLQHIGHEFPIIIEYDREYVFSFSWIDMNSKTEIKGVDLYNLLIHID